MKKNIFIIGGAILMVLILVALWVYIMFFGTPRSLDEVLPDFSFGGSTELPPITPTATTSPEVPLVGTSNKPLRQMTTRPVIGYREVAGSSSTSQPVLYYAEAGTGHIYTIDLTTGVEARRSGTTIIEAADAAFNNDGTTVVFQSGYGRLPKTILGVLATSSDTLSTSELPESIDQFTIVGSSTLLYITTGNTAMGKTTDLRTRTSRTLFTVPFREAAVSWGSTANDTHIIYPKPSYLLPGAVYSTVGGALKRLPLSGYGLSAFKFGNTVAASMIEEGTYTSVFYDIKNDLVFPSSITFLPEKCSGGQLATQYLWCMSFNETPAFGFPDTWHRGEVGLQDLLHELTFSPSSSSLTQLSNLSTESGRAVDAVDVMVGPSSRYVYFINRNDSTLWLYERPQ